MKFELHIPIFSMCFPILSFLICMLWVSISHAASSQFPSSANGGGDLQTLLSIRSQFTIDPFGFISSSWNNAFHFCNWTGVSCDLQQQRVVGLNLAGFELRGTLSSSIGNLTFLKDLNLGNNSFTGSIPHEISKLYHLQRLVLSNNSFTGEIPSNFSYLLEMSVIDFDMNMLIGTIPSEIGFLPNLVELHISQNRLSGTIPEAVGNLSALKLLSLSANNLEGIIPQEFGKLSNLQFLQLSSNQLTGALPLLLHNITTLEEIMLASNDLSGFLPWDFGLYLPNLQTFYIGSNRFLGRIPASITNASELVVFDISANLFYGQVPTDLGNFKRLNRLDFSYNAFGDTSLRFINSLNNCANLGVLHLHYNKFSGMLPMSIANLSNTLVSLKLDGNYINGGIPGGLENLKNLGRLGLSQNSLTGTIPDSIGKLTSLQELVFSNNIFSGGLPPSIGNLTLLSVLEMQQNMLSGGIPASLSNCIRLLTLDLSHNLLIDAIPRPIFSISTLTGLSFAHNLLGGNLPIEVGKLVMLTRFDVSDNLLSGVLPSSLGSCVSLEAFYAQANLFHGSIPASLGQLKGIQYLDLSSNNLVGRIPMDFTSFKFIQFLNLSFNTLEGEVPNKGLFRNSTAFSITGNRNLCGGMKLLHLPECTNLTPKNKGKKLKFSVVMVIPAFVVISFMSIAYVFVFYHRGKRSRSLSIREPMNSPMGEHYPRLSYAELLQATDGFSPGNLIAMGRYSWVYKGVSIDYEQGIAIKVIKLDQSGARRSFVAECEALKHIRHRNLVKIITACSGTDFKGNEFKALVYGFMSNGNLDNWLHPIPTEPKGLDFIQRLNIAIDVASVLVYLHHGCEIPFIHRDIKPSNVLLDDDFCAHLGDFGSARSLLNPVDKSTHGRNHSSAIGIVGTVGYIALEYAVGAPVSTLVDVYSYGILLLEMFSGKRPTDSMFKDNFSLHNYVKKAIPSQVMSVADPRLLAECENDPSREARTRNACEFENCLASVFRVGVICSANVPRERMEIATALMMLQTTRDTLLKVK